MSEIEIGDTVRLRSRGRVIRIEDNRAVVEWSSGSTSRPYLKSLEKVIRPEPDPKKEK